jgi:hypothetical protein
LLLAGGNDKSSPNNKNKKADSGEIIWQKSSSISKWKERKKRRTTRQDMYNKIEFKICFFTFVSCLRSSFKDNIELIFNFYYKL